MTKILIWIILGYVIGSISWALIIGKVFFKKDIRNYGSGNLGGTNAGRVLGKPIGLLVIVLDALKAFIIMWICSYFNKEAIALSGLAVSFGHCFPLFAQFKGGKGVACAMGFLLGIGTFVTNDILYIFIYPIIVFIITLLISKMVSLSSMLALICASLLAVLTFDDLSLILSIIALTIFVIYRHKDNIKRIINKNENKVKFLKY